MVCRVALTSLAMAVIASLGARHCGYSVVRAEIRRKLSLWLFCLGHSGLCLLDAQNAVKLSHGSYHLPRILPAELTANASEGTPMNARVHASQRFDPTDKIFGGCGATQEGSRRSDRTWRCSACGLLHEREEVAAENIRRQGILKHKIEGLSVSARGGGKPALSGARRSHRDDATALSAFSIRSGPICFFHLSYTGCTAFLNAASCASVK